MATTVESLFGVTPQALQAQRNAALQQQALQFAQLDPAQQAQMQLFMGGNRLAGAIGGMLGADDPELARVRQRQQLIQGVNPADPASLRQKALEASQAGDWQAASILNSRAMEIEKELLAARKTEAEILKASREKEGADPFQQLLRTGRYTPESVEAYRVSQNPSSLVLATKEGTDPIDSLIAQGKYTPSSVAAYKKTKNPEDLVLVEKDGTDPLNALIAQGRYTPISVAKYKDSKNPADLVLVEKESADPINSLIAQGKYTPESVAKYKDSKNPTDLVFTEKPGKDSAVSLLQSGKYTPESVGAYLISQDPASLVLVEKGTESLTDKLFLELAKKATPESIDLAMAGGNDIKLLKVSNTDKISTFGQVLTDAGYQRGTPEFNKRMEEFIKSELTGKAKGTGNVSLGGITISSGEAAKTAGAQIGKDIAAVEGKYSALDNISQALSILDKGIFSGTFGPSFMAAAKATSANNPKVVNTEEFMSYVGEIVIPRLQEFGGNDSVEELKYLQRVMGGEQRMETESLRRILLNAERKIKRGIERLQRQSETAGRGQPAPLDAGPGRTAAPQTPRSFKTVQEAEAAMLPKGTRITINGRPAIVE